MFNTHTSDQLGFLGLMFACTPETIFASVASIKAVHLVEFNLYNRNYHELRDTFEGIKIERCLASIPAGNQNLPQQS